MKRQIVHHTITTDKVTKPVTFAVVSDLHNGVYQDILPALHQADAILIPGDLINRHRKGYANAVGFLTDAPRIAPTYYAIGNHEWKFKQRDEYWPHVLNSAVTVLDNAAVPFGEILLGGFSSAEVPQASFMKDFAAHCGFKLLMCHHPEYYRPYVQPCDVDLTIAGHAHGGQIQLFGQGLYAPGQGLLPRLTHGFYADGRLLVSRGMTNSACAPRLWNPCELLLVHITPRTGDASHA